MNRVLEDSTSTCGRTREIDLRSDLLSAGQLELFLFLSELALNEGREGIIFIDEPEIHLDPQWHRLILRSLMAPAPRPTRRRDTLAGDLRRRGIVRTALPRARG